MKPSSSAGPNALVSLNGWTVLRPWMPPKLPRSVSKRKKILTRRERSMLGRLAFYYAATFAFLFPLIGVALANDDWKITDRAEFNKVERKDLSEDHWINRD